MANITLNCLIVPVGDFNDVQCNAVHQTITISTGQHVSDLENAIRARLELEEVPLSLYQIHPRSVQEKKMDSADPISKYYKGQPGAEFFHVTVYSR
ncbi:hypothetical protein RhiirC2_764659 [Rhizophagus irregularis]|uniref:Uncharacterized protein n=1 Tax=Rhizophagus irregularis TaxID=588596 RepID=A0A2N1M116_9GLOM|nr:hypothetical protein RhiirC2_764659 [Rhizophagus irregularis]